MLQSSGHGCPTSTLCTEAPSTFSSEWGGVNTLSATSLFSKYPTQLDISEGSQFNLLISWQVSSERPGWVGGLSISEWPVGFA